MFAYHCNAVVIAHIETNVREPIFRYLAHPSWDLQRQETHHPCGTHYGA